MRKILLILMILAYAGMMSCNSNKTSQSEETNHSHDHTSEHSHDHGDSHDHSEHEHKSHETEAHKHSKENEPHTHSHDNPVHDVDENKHTHEKDEHQHEYHVEKIKTVDFQEVMRTSGELNVLPNHKSTLVAPVSGVIRYTNHQNIPGTRIQRNDILFLISGSSVAENNLLVKLQKSEAIYKQAKQDFERAKKLYAEKLISEKEYLMHQTDIMSARAEYESLAKHYSGKDGVVKSTVGGYVHEIFVNEGEQVNAGQKIATIISKERLMLKAEVSQKYASKLQQYTSANFEAPNGQLYHTEELNGRLISSGKAITSGSFYLPVYFEIDAHPDLMPGSFVHVFLKGRKEKNVIALPTEAFIEEQGNFFVFLKQGEEFVKQKVVVGASDGERMKILSGVKEGDPVVTHGAYHIKLMKASASVPSHGHSH
jgi:RND family efflux transporter MFP subunit